MGYETGYYDKQNECLLINDYVFLCDFNVLIELTGSKNNLGWQKHSLSKDVIFHTDEIEKILQNGNTIFVGNKMFAKDKIKQNFENAKEQSE